MLLDLATIETKSLIGATPLRPVPTADRLLRAIREIAGPLAVVLSHREIPWAGITFSGARHRMALRFAGSDAVSDGESFICALPDHEFRIRGHLVADAAVTRVDHECLPAPLMEVECEILVLDED